MVRCIPSRGPLAAIAAVALIALAAPVARAATPPTDAEIAEARERFAAGRKLEDAGRWAEALTLFQRVAEVRTTPQVRFHIALCLENIGLWTQALDGYQRAVAEAGDTAPDVVQEANDHMKKLAAAMPTVSLVVAGAAAEDEVFLDRRRVLLDGDPLPIRSDPGPHVAEVRRRGAMVARQYFALAPKTALRVELRIGEVAPEVGEKPHEPVPRPPDPAAKPPDPVPTPVAPPQDAPGRVQRAIGWSAVGAGAASTVLAGVFIGLRADAMSRLEQACPGLTKCSPSVADIVAEGKRDATAVNVLGVIGGVAAATGVVLLLTAPASAPQPTRGVSAVGLRVSAGGLSLHGVF